MKIVKKLLAASVVSGFFFSSLVADEALIKKGEKIFTSNTQGNCIACHNANGKTLDGPGSFGTPLTGLKHWPAETLYEIIYDPYKVKGPITAMPSFGKGGWLSDDEIKAVIAYLQTIE